MCNTYTGLALGMVQNLKDIHDTKFMNLVSYGDNENVFEDYFCVASQYFSSSALSEQWIPFPLILSGSMDQFIVFYFELGMKCAVILLLNRHG